MVTPEDRLKDIVRGLEGLIMLSQWELTLARDLRQKAQALAAPQGEAPPPPPESGKQA
jgi:hypothetical protein